MARFDERSTRSLIPRSARRAIGAATLLLLGIGGTAHAWEPVSVMNAYGDHATAIVQASRNQSGVNLVVACEGDRWRSVVIGPPPGASFPLDGGGKVSVSFTSQPGPKEQWQVRRRGKTGEVLYMAPVASALVREMIGHSDASADATLYAHVISKGKPLTIEFPLAGLRAAIRKDLWEPCKLANQIPESEFDKQSDPNKH